MGIGIALVFLVAMAAPGLQELERDEAATLEVYALPDVAARLTGSEQATGELGERVGIQLLAESVRMFADPPFAHPRDAVQPVGAGNLAVLATPAQHAWMRRFIDLQRRAVLARFESEWHLFSIPEAALGAAERGEPRLLDPKAARRFRERLERLPEVRSVGGPPLGISFFAGQKREDRLERGRQVVTDYRIWDHVEPTGERLVDPIVENVNEGLVVRPRAILVPGVGDEARIGLEFVLEGTEIIAIESFETTLAGALDEPVTIGLPELQKVNMASKVVVRSGTTVVFPYRDAIGGRRFVAVLMIRLAD